jgi:hypothetical protein
MSTQRGLTYLMVPALVLLPLPGGARAPQPSADSLARGIDIFLQGRVGVGSLFCWGNSADARLSFGSMDAAHATSRDDRPGAMLRQIGRDRRMREFGICVVLGASRSEVTELAARQGTSMAIVGAGMGLVLSLVASSLMSNLVFGVAPRDPLSVAGATIVCWSLWSWRAMSPLVGRPQ